MNTTEYLKLVDLADYIEEFMFERGEYDFTGDDRIRWLTNNNRIDTAVYILSEIQKDNIEPIINYMKDQLAEMWDDDELIPYAEEIICNLEICKTAPDKIKIDKSNDLAKKVLKKMLIDYNKIYGVRKEEV